MILFIRSTSEHILVNDLLPAVSSHAIINVLIKQISINICARSTVRYKTFICAYRLLIFNMKKKKNDNVSLQKWYFKRNNAQVIGIRTQNALSETPLAI